MKIRQTRPPPTPTPILIQRQNMHTQPNKTGEANPCKFRYMKLDLQSTEGPPPDNTRDQEHTQEPHQPTPAVDKATKEQANVLFAVVR